jgi:hypothetical protein
MVKHIDELSDLSASAAENANLICRGRRPQDGCKRDYSQNNSHSGHSFVGAQEAS